jgi:hypothetical protein
MVLSIHVVFWSAKKKIVQESGSAYKTSGTSLKILNSHGDLLLELTKEGSVCAIFVALK